MIKYFQTTALILLWCGTLSVFWAFLSYWFSTRNLRTLTGIGFLPALALAPMVIVIAYQVFGSNLFFPVSFEVDWTTYLTATLPPALVLISASGLLTSIARNTAMEFNFWRKKPFVTFARSCGASVTGKVGKLVILKSIADSFLGCLPWLFGELIICEVIFNAPGLGLEAWHLAKSRNLIDLLACLGWIMALYLAAAGFAYGLASWIGRRLQSYA